jgi:sorbitol-specific phosphotransferase system component IIBC
VLRLFKFFKLFDWKRGTGSNLKFDYIFRKKYILTIKIRKIILLYKKNNNFNGHQQRFTRKKKRKKKQQNNIKEKKNHGFLCICIAIERET